jgi:hypothetical protein
MMLLRPSFKTSKEPVKVLSEAEFFFKDRGLSVIEKSECCLQLEGGRGYVRIDLQENGGREVTLETREWENPVKEFARRHA